MGEFENDWWKIVKTDPPKAPTVRNFWKGKVEKLRAYGLVDGLCRLLIDCTFQEWRDRNDSPAPSDANLHQRRTPIRGNRHGRNCPTPLQKDL